MLVVVVDVLLVMVVDVVVVHVPVDAVIVSKM